MQTHAADAAASSSRPTCCPRRAAVGRAIDAAAPRRALAIVLLARSGPDDLRVAGEDREIAEGVVGLAVEDRRPERAVVRRLPDAARGRGDVDGRGILRIDLDVVDATAGGGWADRAEVQGVERRLSKRRDGNERDNGETESDAHDERLRWWEKSGSPSMCRAIGCSESPLARCYLTRHPLVVTRRGDPGG